LNRRYSLQGRERFARLYQQGRLWSGAGLKIRYLQLPTATPLFAFSAPRAYGNSVARNRARRVLREVVRHQLSGWPQGLYHFRIGKSERAMTHSAAIELVATFRSTIDA
jgi:ribonuclease P protein component